MLAFENIGAVQSVIFIELLVLIIQAFTKPKYDFSKVIKQGIERNVVKFFLLNFEKQTQLP